MSALRAKCPDCRTLTAVAIGPEYQCHSCGREFGAGIVRVPCAWGDGGEWMTGAAMALPWPEAAVVDAPTLDEQIATQMRELPERPLVVGGCSYAHVGAVRELSRRHSRVALVWVAAPDDPALGLMIASGDVAPADVACLAAGDEPAPLPDNVYVAVHGDALDSGDLDTLEQILGSLPRPVGAGFSGFVSSPSNEVALTRLAHALGL